MNAEIWAVVGTIAGTLLLVIVPGLVYTWYALEHTIGGKRSYPRVIAMGSGRAPRCGRD